jgi:hypothetical protein
VGFFWTSAGRLRLIWRVLLFILLFMVFTVLGSFLALPGLPGQTFPILLAALLAGWISSGWTGGHRVRWASTWRPR